MIRIFTLFLLVGVTLTGCSQKNEKTEDKNTLPTTTETEIPTQNLNDSTFQGEVLAGRAVPFVTFNQADYEQAIADGENIMLQFYATWCPTCRVEQKDLLTGFDQATTENTVAFRVNFDDPETDKFEEGLAEQFGVTYQHHKVFLKNGTEQVLNTNEIWDEEELRENLSKYFEN